MTIKRPESVTSFPITVVGLVGLFAAVWFLREHFDGRFLNKAEVGWAALIVCVSALLPVLLLEMAVLKTWKRPSTGLDWSKPFDFNLSRLVYKIVGFLVTLAALALLYWLLPIYDSEAYQRVFKGFIQHSWWLLPLSFLYIALVDGAMREPEDEYWMLGYGLTRNPKVFTKQKLKAHTLAWTVKGFFAPMMLTFLFGNVTSALQGGWDLSNPVTVIYLAVSIAYLIDLVFAAGGYLLTLRIADTHIRSVEPTTLGWLVALVCYPPFWQPINQYLLPYGQHAGSWQQWLSSYPTLMVLWGGTMAALTLIYGIATVVFGLRFSNLTHRGIITGGPYRLCKHPAYLSKNLAWWFTAVPFVPLMGWENSLKACLMLLGINFIYYMRALTEERHLSRDPAYVEYALWMNDHSPLRFINRLLPFVRYKAPQNK